MFVKTSPHPQLEVVKNAIGLIVNENTDFATLSQELHTFWNNQILQKNNSIPQGKDVLAGMETPLNGLVTSPFGARIHPTEGSEKFHYGVDIGAPAGEKIKCAAEGTAIEVGSHPEYGNYILVLHDDEVYTLYAHCETLLPQQGDRIKAGQVIATVGATGNVTGPHLHFEIRNGDTYLDPSDFVSLETEAAHD